MIFVPWVPLVTHILDSPQKRHCGSHVIGQGNTRLRMVCTENWLHHYDKRSLFQAEFIIASGASQLLRTLAKKNFSASHMTTFPDMLCAFRCFQLAVTDLGNPWAFQNQASAARFWKKATHLPTQVQATHNLGCYERHFPRFFLRFHGSLHRINSSTVLQYVCSSLFMIQLDTSKNINQAIELHIYDSCPMRSFTQNLWSKSLARALLQGSPPSGGKSFLEEAWVARSLLPIT